MIWIIIANEKLGGAEKRFTGIWEGLVKQAGYSGSVKVVLPPALYNIFLLQLSLRIVLKNTGIQ
jgi:hypothetical protein